MSYGTVIGSTLDSADRGFELKFQLQDEITCYTVSASWNQNMKKELTFKQNNICIL
jgi:hypothetical protein